MNTLTYTLWKRLCDATSHIYRTPLHIDRHTKYQYINTLKINIDSDSSAYEHVAQQRGATEQLA